MLEPDLNSNDPFGIIDSTKFVMREAKDVELDSSKVNDISKLIQEKLDKGISSDAEYALGLTGDLEHDAQLLIVEDAVNFCFWAEKDQEKWKVEWPKGNIVSGGWYGVLAVFERAQKEKVPLLDAEFLSNLTSKQINSLFRSATGTEIPLIHDRLNNLIEVGMVLIKKYDGKFLNLIEESEYDAIKIVENVYNDFPSFRDEATYKNRKIYFLKRAQIIANDVCYLKRKGKNIKVKNRNKLTAFADYKIPQMLRHFGVLKYSNDLAELVDSYNIIPAFNSEEIEIRAATIQGIEMIKQNMENKYTSSEIDNALWLISQDQSGIEKPYHRTYTIFY